jgi:hypothetical protein
MRAVLSSVAACLLAAAAVVAGTPMASAAGTPTSVFLAVSPATRNNPPSLLNPSIILDGTLWNAQASTPVATPEPVTVTEQVAGTGPAVTVGTLMTDTSGNFTVSLSNVTAGGIFTASFPGDAANGYAASASSPVTVQAAGSVTTITLSTAPKAVIPAGSTVTFAGMAYVNDNGKHIPVPHAIATIYRNANPTAIHAPVAADGSFRLSVKPSGHANWWVGIDPVTPWPYALYLGGRTPIRNVNVVQVHRTRVAAISVPGEQDIDNLGVTGTVQALTGSVWGPAVSVEVWYYFRVLPSGDWQFAGSSNTNSRGVFRWAGQSLSYLLGKNFHGHLAWQAVISGPQVVGSQEYRGSTSVVRDSYAADATVIGDFHSQYSSGSTFLLAVVQDSGGALDVEFPQGTAYFYYLPAGGRTWRNLGSGQTDTGGGVSLAVLGKLHGHFRVVFPVQGHFLRSSAEISVR